MSAWTVVYTEQAYNDLPFRYRLYEKEPWRGKGLRVLPVDNYLVFYLPIEDQRTVAIIRIMYGRRDIEKQLSKETKS
jgi:toxin ParE1/3/4